LTSFLLELEKDHPLVQRNGGLKKEVVFHQGDNM